MQKVETVDNKNKKNIYKRLLRIFLIIVVFMSFLLFSSLNEIERASYFKGKKLDTFDARQINYMYPTFSWCKVDNDGIEDCAKYAFKESFLPNLFIKDEAFQPERGSIIRTKDVLNDYYVFGRIVGLPDETISLRNGLVFINDALLDEPYVHKRESTFGGSYFLSCKDYKVPKNQVFVLGDNRDLSNQRDSRSALGFVALDNITHYLPLKYQNIYKNRWKELANKPLENEIPIEDTCK